MGHFGSIKAPIIPPNCRMGVFWVNLVAEEDAPKCCLKNPRIPPTIVELCENEPKIPHKYPLQMSKYVKSSDFGG